MSKTIVDSSAFQMVLNVLRGAGKEQAAAELEASAVAIHPTAVLTDPSGTPLDVDWENLAKRLIAAMQIGIRIEQDSGHRYISEDPNGESLDPKIVHYKQYGSYASCLDVIDNGLQDQGRPSLLDTFEQMDLYDSLGFVFGEGTQ